MQYCSMFLIMHSTFTDVVKVVGPIFALYFCIQSRPLGLKEIDGLSVPPGKASTLLTDHPITG